MSCGDGGGTRCCKPATLAPPLAISVRRRAAASLLLRRHRLRRSRRSNALLQACSNAGTAFGGLGAPTRCCKPATTRPGPMDVLPTEAAAPRPDGRAAYRGSRAPASLLQRRHRLRRPQRSDALLQACPNAGTLSCRPRETVVPALRSSRAGRRPSTTFRQALGETPVPALRSSSARQPRPTAPRRGGRGLHRSSTAGLSASTQSAFGACTSTPSLGVAASLPQHNGGVLYLPIRRAQARSWIRTYIARESARLRLSSVLLWREGGRADHVAVVASRHDAPNTMRTWPFACGNCAFALKTRS